MSFYVYYPPNNEVTAVITGPITVNQGTTPWIVSGTVTANQGTNPWTVDGTVAATQSGVWNIGTVTTITNPVTVNQGTNPWTVDGTVNIGNFPSSFIVNQGTSPWIVGGTVAATQSGTWNIGTVSTITNPVTVNQGTSPWVVSGTIVTSPDVNIHDSAGNSLNSTSGSLNVDVTNAVPVTQSTSPWVVGGTVAATQSGTWNIGTVTTITNPVTVNQGTSPWIISGTVTSSDDHNYGIVGANTLRTAAQIGNATGAANFNAGTTTAQTLRVVLPTDQTAIPVSQSGTWNIGTVSTITNPVTVNQGTSPWVVSGTITTSPNVNIHDSGGNSLNSTAGSLDVFLTNPVDQGGAALPSNAWYMRITDGVTTAGVINFGLSTYNVNGNGADAVPIRDGGNSITVDGTVTVNQGTSPWVVSGSTTVSGTVAVSNFPATVNTNYGTVGASTIRTASQIGNATGAADFGSGTTSAQTLRVVLPTNQTAIPVTQSGTWTTGRTWTLSDTTDTIQNSPIDGIKATYSSSFYNLLTGASNATDIFTITGSATKTIRILEIGISGDRTTSSAIDMLLVKRSTANSGGTGFPVATAPHDSTNPASTTVPVAYSVSPTLGTIIAVVRSEKMFLNAAATGESDTIVWQFGNNPGQAIVLRGNSQVLAVNLNGVTVTGGTFDIYITWTEE